MKEFFVAMFLVMAYLFSPLTGAFGDDAAAVPVVVPDSINDDAEPIGTVSDPGPGENGHGQPNAGRSGNKRADH